MSLLGISYTMFIYEKPNIEVLVIIIFYEKPNIEVLVIIIFYEKPNIEVLVIIKKCLCLKIFQKVNNYIKKLKISTSRQKIILR